MVSSSLIFAASVSVLLLFGSSFGDSGLKRSLNIHEIAYRRLKRQSGISNGGGSEWYDQLICSFKCYSIAGGAIVQALTDAFSGGSPDYFNGGSNPQQERQQFEDSCNMYNQIKDCDRQCPRDDVGAYADSLYDGVDYICGANVAQFSEFIPCYRQVEREIGLNCTSECGKRQAEDSGNMGSKFSNKESLQQIMGTVLDTGCQFTGCMAECEMPMITQRCGAEAARMYTAFMSRSVGGVEKVIDSAASVVGGSSSNTWNSGGFNDYGNNNNQFGNQNNQFNNQRGQFNNGNFNNNGGMGEGVFDQADNCRRLIQAGSFFNGPSNQNFNQNNQNFNGRR